MNSLLMKMLFLAVLSLSLLSGCATRTVDVVQAEQFKLMADRMSEELIARNILDKSRNYTAGVFGGGENYGEELFRRLSPAFLLDDAVGVMAGPTFADSMRHSDKVEKRQEGFTIRGQRRQVRVDMVAVTDWEGDGRKYWVVACEMLRARGAIPRIYYVIVPEPDASGQGTLTGTVAAVYEDLGVTGRLYVRDSKVQKAEMRDATAPAVVEEAVPGLKNVTVPPGTPAPKGSVPQGVKERILD